MGSPRARERLRGDKSLFESIKTTSLTERIICQLVYGWQKDIKTFLMDECEYRVQETWFSCRVIDNLADSTSLTESNGLKARGTKVGASVEEPEVGNVSLILLIF